MANLRNRGVLSGAVTGAVTGASGLSLLFLSYMMFQDRTSFHTSQWPLGIVFALLLGAQIGSIAGAGIALVRQEKTKEGGWVCLAGGLFVASFWWRPVLQELVQVIVSGQGGPALSNLLQGVLYGALFGGSLVALGLWFLLKRNGSKGR